MPEDDICENCNAGQVVGAFDLEDVETLLCASCSAYVTVDGKVVVLYHA